MTSPQIQYYITEDADGSVFINGPEVKKYVGRIQRAISKIETITYVDLETFKVKNRRK